MRSVWTNAHCAVLVVALTLCSLACGNSSTNTAAAPSGGGTSSSTSFQLLVSAPLGLFVGDVGQASAGALTTSISNVSNQATWQSSNPSIATVVPGGAVTAIAPGAVTLTATYQGVSASDTLMVLRDSDLLSLTILSCSSQLLVGQTVDCAVTMTTTGPSTGLNVASKAAWSSTNAGVVSITPGGHVTAVSSGQATISASYHAKTGSLPVTVTAAQQDSIRINGGAQTGQFRAGNTVSLSLDGLYSVVSAASGQLSLRVVDQSNAVITTTTPIVVPRGSNSFFLTASFSIPATATRVCPAAILLVGSATIVETGSTQFSLCASVIP
jgi:hypothetical protein